MISIGVILWGPELREKAIGCEIDRLARALAPREDANVGIVFSVPGSLGPPAREPIRVSRATTEHPVVVLISIREDVAQSTAPLPDLVRLVREAISFAARKRRKAIGELEAELASELAPAAASRGLASSESNDVEHRRPPGNPPR